MKISKTQDIIIKNLQNTAISILGSSLPILYISSTFEDACVQNMEKFIEVREKEKLISLSDLNGIFITKWTNILFCFNEELNHLTLEVYTKSGILIPDTMATNNEVINVLSLWVLFKKYAEVETKILPPKSNFGTRINGKYINQTNHTIVYLDSKWFTNLVKSDAFKVSGHFRLQPCHDENGLPTKKLIWINEFMKTGYTSKAKKLNEVS